MTTPNPNERLLRFLQATPDQQAAIDRILDGKVEPEAKPRTGPLLLGMGPAAKFLGVSRGTPNPHVTTARAALPDLFEASVPRWGGFHRG